MRRRECTRAATASTMTRRVIGTGWRSHSSPSGINGVKQQELVAGRTSDQLPACSSRCLTCLGHELEHATVRLVVRHDVKGSVRPLTHVANLLAFRLKVREQPLLADHFLPVELEAHEIARAVAADEQI